MNTAPTPHDNTVSVKLGHYIHLLKRTSIRLDDWFVVSSEVYDSLVNTKDYGLMIHFEPFTSDDTDSLTRLGFTIPNDERQLWKFVDLDVWHQIYKRHLEEKATQEINRAKAVEFTAYASKKLAFAKNRLMGEWGNTPADADRFLNMILNPSATEGAFVNFRKMLNLEDLLGKVSDVAVYCKVA